MIYLPDEMHDWLDFIHKRIHCWRKWCHKNSIFILKEAWCWCCSVSPPSLPLPSCRHEFDSEQIPDLSRDVFRQDIHSVGSLCKLYFRELPNPLLTYQLYDRFSVRIQAVELKLTFMPAGIKIAWEAVGVRGEAAAGKVSVTQWWKNRINYLKISLFKGQLKKNEVIALRWAF